VRKEKTRNDNDSSFFYIYSFFVVSQLVFSQNLVLNGSFEQYSTCPNSTGQLPYCNNWQFSGASTDYYNNCAGGAFVSVPQNLQGFQYSSHGNGYLGMIVLALHEEQDTSNYFREPAGSFLGSSI